MITGSYYELTVKSITAGFNKSSGESAVGDNLFYSSEFKIYEKWHKKGIPSAESSHSMRGLGNGVSGKPYPR